MAKYNIVISGYYGFHNAGDEAMLLAILQALRKTFDAPSITVISGNPSDTAKTFGVKAVPRFGILPILFIGGLSSAATNLLFAVLAGMGADRDMLIFTISMDNFSSGLATAAFVAYLSSLTNLKFSATQYALLSSIMLLLPRLIGGYSGSLVEKLGYEQFFVTTALLGIPTLLLIALQWRNQPLQPMPASSDDATQPTAEQR